MLAGPEPSDFHTVDLDAHAPQVGGRPAFPGDPYGHRRILASVADDGVHDQSCEGDGDAIGSTFLTTFPITAPRYGRVSTVTDAASDDSGSDDPAGNTEHKTTEHAADDRPCQIVQAHSDVLIPGQSAGGVDVVDGVVGGVGVAVALAGVGVAFDGVLLGEPADGRVVPALAVFDPAGAADVEAAGGAVGVDPGGGAGGGGGGG